ncbi:MAG TPA: bifunctional methylenetetrahydrofolate dehydrogenase/methenyltetrahydrofolate cyclohydrolase FolD [Thermodesulfovibrio thiophilus]|uniref:bifunctional methylenetetrahydrofolate dehydrogenase/methenyltetrahydrofolate cyclohydrolase FolD n=1 Tax=Thermodesulfovibrio thiophilus TaxID=340095 RepID=UPI00180692AB|nr:bifunctional methylenetetrahydrofolate dehydrogenase/methenyltetrahydrofolate cyclohydrolase FolD [Thermodesulfovibrio thiophilus]HHW19906.1 bifunctional methylenetetrahydrofolate dehydrogenase/methenyltetrahydrofolate cyclohydrolase FolD [Thermodesulfovibrio thiophilus]HOA82496.1 bifunctional methylenetetrahydrofolate dehydrogenase/methenyltetrahydrofolate cyclohydrolase FolD [Thermodesulfovibrio thiophilus]HQA03125.1 bifunctional methylenetetrahydrofolate dehydrogenase/methenyltetrahydrofol
MTEILDGKLLSFKIRENIKKDVEVLKNSGISPCLAVIVVGYNKASLKYVSFKEKACKELGIESMIFKLPENTEEINLIKLIEELNNNQRINGILIQLPLPSHLDQNAILEKISPFKDVDGFTPYCLGRLLTDNPLFIPCTPKGVLKMFDEYKIALEGKHAVVVGRSIIVGKPLSLLLLRKNATVSICHSRTRNLTEITKKADILCVAIGKERFISADMIKEGAVVIDIGINVTDTGRVVGDIDFDEVKEKASYITPVPGGVGPMTIAMLMENTVIAAKIQKELSG